MITKARVWVALGAGVALAVVSVGWLLVLGPLSRGHQSVRATATPFTLRSRLELSLSGGHPGNCPGFPVDRVLPSASANYNVVIGPAGDTSLVDTPGATYLAPTLKGTTTATGKLAATGQNEGERLDLSGSITPTRFDGKAVLTVFGPNGSSCPFEYVATGPIGRP